MTNQDNSSTVQSLSGFGWKIKVPHKLIDTISKETPIYYNHWKKKKLNPDKTPKIVKGKIQYRPICESTGILKLIQKRIDKVFLKNLPLPPCTLGGVSPFTPKDNAKRHQGKKYHFQTDLKDFFPSITNKMVFDMLIENGFNPPISSLITRIVTLEGKLPQGTPTSTSIANLVFAPVCIEILKICNENDIAFTQWVDDLNFSSQQEFHLLFPQILYIITTGGFRINHRKTHYKIGPIPITGLIAKNNSILIPDELYKRANDPSIPEKSRIGVKHYIDSVLSNK